MYTIFVITLVLFLFWLLGGIYVFRNRYGVYTFFGGFGLDYNRRDYCTRKAHTFNTSKRSWNPLNWVACSPFRYCIDTLVYLWNRDLDEEEDPNVDSEYEFI